MDAISAAPTRTPSTWAVPSFSTRFMPIWRRNFLVWRKLAVASVLGNIADPLITLIAFGYGLGSLVQTVNGIPYIQFLASGSICMSIMMASSFEALYSAFSRMHVQKTWDALLNAPLDLDDVVLAEMLWAATKAIFSGVAILLVMFLLGIGLHPHTVLVLPVLFLVGMTFASIGLVVNAVAHGYEFFTYYFTLVLTPMIFLSGVYYPTAQLPGWLQIVSHLLPLSAAVQLVRPLILGQWPVDSLFNLAVPVFYCVGAFYVATLLTRRRLLN
ncbi:MAG: nodulation protein NodJ [Herminiimonas sp.]|nr:nodulation protein NodJ [Herminiimonas sp.]